MFNNYHRNNSEMLLNCYLMNDLQNSPVIIIIILAFIFGLDIRRPSGQTVHQYQTFYLRLF